jgi:hypothetical protein
MGHILETIRNQNYFQFKGNFYKPKTGIATGSPLSGIVAESSIQYLEQQILKALESKTIVYYTRYIDDIFIIYDHCKATQN